MDTRLKHCVRALAAALAVSAVAASSASAVTWQPAGTEITGAGLTYILMAGPYSGSWECDDTSIEGTTTSPVSAELTLTGPSGITFQDSSKGTGTCDPGGSGLGIPLKVETAGDWTLEAASPTAVTVNIPDGGAKLTLNHWAFTCTVTLGENQFSAKWSNASRQLSFYSGGLEFESSGLICPTTLIIQGTLTLSPGTLEIS